MEILLLGIRLIRVLIGVPNLRNLVLIRVIWLPLMNLSLSRVILINQRWVKKVRIKNWVKIVTQKKIDMMVLQKLTIIYHFIRIKFLNLPDLIIVLMMQIKAIRIKALKNRYLVSPIIYLHTIIMNFQIEKAKFLKSVDKKYLINSIATKVDRLS